MFLMIRSVFGRSPENGRRIINRSSGSLRLASGRESIIFRRILFLRTAFLATLAEISTPNRRRPTLFFLKIMAISGNVLRLPCSFNARRSFRLRRCFLGSTGGNLRRSTAAVLSPDGVAKPAGHRRSLSGCDTRVFLVV
jgi:hypothetical protein